MLAIERRRKIISLLEEKNSVLVPELSRIFDVTEETIRRDLEKLEKEGFLKRTYGGAVVVESTNLELPLKIREVTNIDIKEVIGIKAAEFIEDGDTIALDSSTTALQVAKHIKSRKRLIIITNSINIIYELSNSRDITVISTGGILRHSSMSFVGHLAEDSIKKYNVDKAIISCKGVNMEREVTESNEAEAEVKRAMVEAADKIYLIADHTKLNKVSLVNMLELERIDMFFTDEMLTDEWEQMASNKNIKLVYC